MLAPEVRSAEAERFRPVLRDLERQAVNITDDLSRGVGTGRCRRKPGVFAGCLEGVVARVATVGAGVVPTLRQALVARVVEFVVLEVVVEVVVTVGSSGRCRLLVAVPATALATTALLTRLTIGSEDRSR